MKTKAPTFLAWLILTSLSSTPLWSYVYLYNQSPPIIWAPGIVTLQLKVDNSAVLSDGTTRATTILAAAQSWNVQISSLQLSLPIAAVGLGSDGNSVNEIFFADSVYDSELDSSTLAITTVWTSGGTQHIESDVIFNTAYSWDSYRGRLRVNGVQDIRRVALHELGHVLGLDHPDDYFALYLPTIMVRTVSNTDTLQIDDITGAQSLYGVPGGGSPVNDNFANALTISGGGSSGTDRSNLGASKEPGEPNHGGNVGGRSIWWKRGAYHF